MAKIRLSLTPLAEHRWETEPSTGARFLIAPMPAERDAEIQRECSDMLGNVNTQLVAEKVCTEFLKGWEGVGNGTSEVACNAESIKTFVKWHGQGLAQFVVRKSRSLAHFVAEEVEAAKKG